MFVKLAAGFSYDDSTGLTFRLNGSVAGLANAGSPVAGLPFAAPKLKLITAPTNLALDVQESDLPKTVPADDSWWQSVKINGVDRVRIKPEAIDDIWIVTQYSTSG